MQKIAFIVPYFGKFNNYFQLWLNSCAKNPSIEWQVFTDDRRDFSYPQNVHVFYTDLKSIKELAEDKLGFSISLSKPYKLCDLRAVYGVVFEDYIKQYDFWGYCDTDLIWGDIRKFISDEILGKYDRIFKWGHCCLIRNNKTNNRFFEHSAPGVHDLKKVLQSPLSFGYDEANQSGKIFEVHFADTYFKENFCYDVKVSSLSFKPASSMVHAIQNTSLFTYNNGQIFGYTIENDNLVRKEYMYVHLQKRPMQIEIYENLEIVNRFLIVPNRFVSFADITIEKFMALSPKSFFYPLAFKRKCEYYIDAIFDNKEPHAYERGRLKKFFDLVFFRDVNK